MAILQRWDFKAWDCLAAAPQLLSFEAFPVEALVSWPCRPFDDHTQNAARKLGRNHTPSQFVASCANASPKPSRHQLILRALTRSDSLKRSRKFSKPEVVVAFVQLSIRVRLLHKVGISPSSADTGSSGKRCWRQSVLHSAPWSHFLRCSHQMQTLSGLDLC
jgi:hypothetical protein